MTELKTLKDLFDLEYQDEFILYSAIQKEAVKWVKFVHNIDTQNFIKTFFDFSDEDLK